MSLGRDEFLEILKRPKYAIVFLKERMCEMTDEELTEFATELYIRIEARQFGKRRRRVEVSAVSYG